MQSTEEKRLQEEPGCSQGLTNGDSNANLLNGVKNPESRGAIPKIKTAKAKSKKTVKLNNNIEDVSENCSFILEFNDTSGSVGLGSESVIDLTCDIRNFRLANDSDDDELSISDDGCIYTYKGDQDADLPVSFFSLDVPQEVAAQSECRRHSYSPEMDYLEMDFDPGPGGDYEPPVEAKTDEPEEVREDVGEARIVNGKMEREAVTEEIAKKEPEISIEVKLKEVVVNKREEEPKLLREEVFKNNKLENKVMPWSCQLEERTTMKGSGLIKKYHLGIGELVRPGDVEKSSPVDEPGSPDPGDESIMIWSPAEARARSVAQIGPSACGATAVLNALAALNFPTSIAKIQQNINTRLRKNSAPLAEYLVSRSVAGTTHDDIVDCIGRVTEDRVYARFFCTYPERVVNLGRWLRFWLRNGAVAIATLNIQQAPRGAHDVVPDAWHHQMIFGVSPRGIHFTNPVECVPEEHVWSYLVSESVLLVRRDDIASRFDVRTDLPALMSIEDQRWRDMNVVGQVAHIIYQSRRELRNGFKNTPHIQIPAAYSPGVTIAIPVASPVCALLQQCPELPVLEVGSKRPA